MIKLLIAEDQGILLTTLATILELEDDISVIHQSVDGKDALDFICDERQPTIDIILSDIEMPRMDGFEVVSRVRHNNRLQHIPICMITSRTGDKHRQRAIGLGASEYLGKPFQERELLETISKLTGAEVLHG